jgi:fermentation-respiration switch protein FrsA (DUF1100 family)
VTLATLVVAVALAYAALCAFIYATQRSMIYFPTAEASPAGARPLEVRSQGETLRVWAGGVGLDDAGTAALIYFGGNADDVAVHLPAFVAAWPRRALYLVNYRGYGGSTGTPSEAALGVDAAAVYDAVRRRHHGAPIAVIGRSLGSGVAVQLAAARPVDRLVLVTPFDSLVEVARTHFRWLPVHALLRDRFDSAARVRAGEVDAPTLIVIAGDDEVVPAARGEALAAAFPPGQLVVERIEGATHNTVDSFPRYLERVARFVDSR